MGIEVVSTDRFEPLSSIRFPRHSNPHYGPTIFNSFYDTIRPMTTINEIFAGSTVGDWRADKEAVIDDRDQWRPYQSDKSLTPPFPDVPSGHSAFSTSASVVLRNMLGSNVDDFTTETFKSRFDLEKGVDGLASNGSEEWTFNYKTHSRPADDSGYSRLYGGIHLMQGNIVGMSELHALLLVDLFPWNFRLNCSSVNSLLKA